MPVRRIGSVSGGGTVINSTPSDFKGFMHCVSRLPLTATNIRRSVKLSYPPRRICSHKTAEETGTHFCHPCTTFEGPGSGLIHHLAGFFCTIYFQASLWRPYQNLEATV
jgi:hypothetical protein